MCREQIRTLQEQSIRKLLDDDIDCRIKHSKCLSQCSRNYADETVDDYKLKLVLLTGKKYREIMNEPDELISFQGAVRCTISVVVS
jgi:hypothetical protein